MYSLNGDWDRTLLFSNDSGESWDVVDFGTYMLLGNSEQIFYRDPDTNLYSEVDYDDIPLMESFCDFNGQIFGCGIQSDWYDADERFAIWSNIDNVNFTPDRKNVAGMQDMKIGSLVKCLAMSNGVVFYGDEGVAKLIPAGNSTAFTYMKLSNVSIANKNVAHGKDEQIFISNTSRLYSVTNEGVQELGFEYHLGVLDLSATRITFDELNNEFYISDGVTCFIYANGNLLNRSKNFTSLIMIDDTLYGAYDDVDEDILIGSDDLDFNLVTMKNYETVELGLSTDGSAYVRAKIYYNLGQDVTYSPWVRVNDSGFAHIGVAANKASIEIKIEDPTVVELTHFTVGIKLTDNRVQNQRQTLMDGTWNGR